MTAFLILESSANSNKSTTAETKEFMRIFNIKSIATESMRKNSIKIQCLLYGNSGSIRVLKQRLLLLLGRRDDPKYDRRDDPKVR